MATNTSTALVTSNSKASKGQAAQPASTTPAALAPTVGLAVPQPSTVELPNWHIAGQPSTAKGATNGVGPAPKQGTVLYAALACIAANKGGATLAQLQAAVVAVGLRGKHPVLPLLRWAAANRGYTFVCTNGLVQLG